MAATKTDAQTDLAPSQGETNAAAAAASAQAAVTTAEAATARATREGRLPATAAVANPAAATTMDVGSGAFVEPELVSAVPTDHPAVEGNPRRGTSAIQNGGDFNDPFGRAPGEKNFAGQGLDLTVYGSAAVEAASKA